MLSESLICESFLLKCHKIEFVCNIFLFNTGIQDLGGSVSCTIISLLKPNNPLNVGEHTYIDNQPCWKDGSLQTPLLLAVSSGPEKCITRFWERKWNHVVVSSHSDCCTLSRFMAYECWEVETCLSPLRQLSEVAGLGYPAFPSEDPSHLCQLFGGPCELCGVQPFIAVLRKKTIL